MSEKQLTWIPHIPLIGGFPIGAEIALGTAPEFIASLPGFLGNDKHWKRGIMLAKGKAPQVPRAAARRDGAECY